MVLGPSQNGHWLDIYVYWNLIEDQQSLRYWHGSIRQLSIIIVLLFWNILVKICCIMSSYNDPIHHSAIRSSPSSDNIYQYQPLPGPRVTRHHGIPSLNVKYYLLTHIYHLGESGYRLSSSTWLHIHQWQFWWDRNSLAPNNVVKCHLQQMFKFFF